MISLNLVSGSGILTSELRPGAYTVETRDLRGVLVGRRRVTFEAGNHTIDLSAFEANPLRESLLSGIRGYHKGGAVDFSETLGPTPDQGMDLWLALVGAARIMGGVNEFSKLSPLPLASFAHVTAGAAPIYLLAGLENPDVVFRAAVSSNWREKPSPIQASPDFPGLFELVVDLRKAAYHFLTIHVDETASLTVGVCSLPNRATPVTVSRDVSRNLRVQQFILPLHKVRHLLPHGAGLWTSAQGDELDELSLLRTPSGPKVTSRRTRAAPQPMNASAWGDSRGRDGNRWSNCLLPAAAVEPTLVRTFRSRAYIHLGRFS